MLKIVCGETGRNGITIKLEGNVIGPWVQEVKRESEKVLARGAVLTLDLSGVSYVDREGLELLRALKDRQAMLRNTSVFVAEQLKS